jgi:hypothetical protein
MLANFLTVRIAHSCTLISNGHYLIGSKAVSRHGSTARCEPDPLLPCLHMKLKARYPWQETHATVRPAPSGDAAAAHRQRLALFTHYTLDVP